MIENKVFTRFISEGDIPKDNQYVLGKLKGQFWLDNDDERGNRFFVVVKFEKGLTINERNALPEKDPRKTTFKRCDEEGNNLKGYGWSTLGPSYYFGQEIDEWIDLSELNP